MKTIRMFLESTKDIPDDTLVMVKGKEGAWNNLTTVEKKELIVDYYKGRVFGHHVTKKEIKSTDLQDKSKGYKLINATCLSHERYRPEITAGEFKEMLNTFPSDSILMVEGYEGGWNDLGTVEMQELMLDFYDGEFIGHHEDVREHESEKYHVQSKENYSVISALCLSDTGNLP